MPYPSDLRLMGGAPDVRGFPNTLFEPIIEGLQTVTAQRLGFPQMPTAYFQFTAPITPQDPTVTIPASTSSPILLVDVDQSSPERGKLFPVLAGTPPSDRYLVDNTLEVAPLVGVVLEHGRTYAFVVMKSLRDATNAPLGVPDEFTVMEQATAPAADPELTAWNLYQSLWPTLTKIGVAQADVAAATVFTTGDVVQNAADLASKVIAQDSTQVTGLNVPSTGNQPRFCELVGQVSFPQFQQGTPPFDTQGTFDIGSDGLPIKQADEVVPVAISFPQAEMPTGGWPLILYFHGSGGLSTQIFDGELELDTPGMGPAYVVAPYGFAMASSALPLNPERYPAGDDIDYINFNNLAAFPYTFEQGTIEQRMFISALVSVSVDPSVVTACTGMSLPTGETAYHFNMTPLHIQGQSMGGMYTNLVGATDPRPQIAVPTGAGGYWSYMVLTTQAIMNAPNDLKLLLGSGDLHLHAPGASAPRDRMGARRALRLHAAPRARAARGAAGAPGLRARRLHGLVLLDRRLRRRGPRVPKQGSGRHRVADDAAHACDGRARRHRSLPHHVAIARHGRAVHGGWHARSALHRAHARCREVPVRVLPPELPDDRNGDALRPEGHRFAVRPLVRARRPSRSGSRRC